MFRKKEKLAHRYMTEASLTDDQDKYDDHNVLYIKSHVMQVKMYQSGLKENTKIFHVVLSGEALLVLAGFLRPSELLPIRDR